MRRIHNISLGLVALIFVVAAILLAYSFGHVMGFVEGRSMMYQSQIWVATLAGAAQDMIDRGYREDFFKRIDGGQSIRPTKTQDQYELYMDSNKLYLALKVSNGVVSIIDPEAKPRTK